MRIFCNHVGKIQVLLKSDKNNRYFTFIISCKIVLRMRNVVDKNCRENQNTHSLHNNFFLENCTIYEIMWEK